MYSLLNRSTVYICSSVNEVVDASVEAFRKKTCVTVDIKKKGIGKMIDL